MLHSSIANSCQAQCALQRPPTTRPTTFHVWKTRDCQRSFRLLMMGGVSPETCWASYKYGTIKVLIHCCILLDFSLRIVFCSSVSPVSYLPVFSYRIHFMLYSHFVPSLKILACRPVQRHDECCIRIKMPDLCLAIRQGLATYFSYTRILLSVVLFANPLTLLLILGN